MHHVHKLNLVPGSCDNLASSTTGDFGNVVLRTSILPWIDLQSIDHCLLTFDTACLSIFTCAAVLHEWLMHAGMWCFHSAWLASQPAGREGGPSQLEFCSRISGIRRHQNSLGTAECVPGSCVMRRYHCTGGPWFCQTGKRLLLINYVVVKFLYSRNVRSAALSCP